MNNTKDFNSHLPNTNTKDSQTVNTSKKVYLHFEENYFIKVQTFKFTLEDFSSPLQILTIQENDNHPALKQFLNTVWKWLHDQGNNMNKLIIKMPDNLQCDDWFCKRCYYYNQLSNKICKNIHCNLNRLNNDISLLF